MDNKMPQIAVLILGYNDKVDLEDSIGSSIDQTYRNYKVIYIDNNSSDASISFISEHYPDVRIIKNTTNLGYAGAYNLALEKIFSENFDGAVLLNPDVIVDRNWLTHLVETAYLDEKIAIAQPKIFLWDGKENNLANTFGNKINYLGFGFCGNYKEKDSEKFGMDIEITYASGCSMLIKRDCYREIGNLDEKFFMYYEDQDLCWRARMKGFRIMLSSKSIIFHKYKFQRGGFHKRKIFLLERNRLYFIIKNYSIRTILLICPALIFVEIGIILDSMLKGYFFEKLKGYCHIIKNLNPLLADRKNIQSGRRVGDAELYDLFSPTIDFEEMDGAALKLMNVFLKYYYVLISKLI